MINRIQGLEAMGRLTGVMDDRGKVRPEPYVQAWIRVPVLSKLVLFWKGPQGIVEGASA